MRELHPFAGLGLMNDWVVPQVGCPGVLALAVSSLFY